MATLKTNTLTGTSTAGSIAVTGEGNSTTTNLQQGLCKCWVNFDGSASAAASRDSFNVGSMTDVATGRHSANFTNNMANINYAAIVMSGDISDNTSGRDEEIMQLTTALVKVRIMHQDESDRDEGYVGITVHGDLA